MEHPIKMDDLGVPLFLETPMFVQIVDAHPRWDLGESTVDTPIFRDRRPIARDKLKFPEEKRSKGIGYWDVLLVRRN